MVAWAASNADHSENADYQYGKRRPRQIDGRIRFLTKREAAEVVVPETPRSGQAATRTFFGATVRPFTGRRCKLRMTRVPDLRIVRLLFCDANLDCGTTVTRTPTIFGEVLRMD